MDRNRKKVLIVEDDDNLRKILADGLSASNFELFEALDGEEAVNVVMNDRPDLILLDLLLPKLDGFAVLERLRHYPKEAVAQTHVVVLSNLWSNKDILRAKALKVDEYFVKANTNVEDVFVKIKEILSNPHKS